MTLTKKSWKKKRRMRKRRKKKSMLQLILHLPVLTPAAGAHTGLTDEELAALEATSVELLPDEEREAALAAAAAKSAAAPKSSPGPGPARAGPSGPPSTVGSVPASAETLQAELRELYRPDQEPVADYLTRLARVVLALRAYGVNVGQPELRSRLRRPHFSPKSLGS